jgi:hypothetical protein
VIEWEPYRKERAFIIMQKFSALYPPHPGFPEECLKTAESLVKADLPGHVRRAMEAFRVGVLTSHPDEQFQQFWMAIEILAEGEKDPALVPVTCPDCRNALHCPHCNKTPLRRPVAQEAIRAMIGKIGTPDPEATFKRLYGVRNHIMHGRSTASVERTFGQPMIDFMNEAAKVAWYSIALSLPEVDKLVFAGHEGIFNHHHIVPHLPGKLAHNEQDKHPDEDAIPSPVISIKTIFGEPY